MKKIIIILFAFISINSFGQEKEKKHNLLWDIGVNHTSNWKPKYHPAYEKKGVFPKPETLFPGYYTYPAFKFRNSIVYRFFFYKGLNLNINFNTSFAKNILTISPDSLNKYYIYSDSVIRKMESDIPNYTYYGSPIYNKSRIFKFGININIGYRYRRFLILTGIQFPLFEYRKSYSKYKNNINRTITYKSNTLTDKFGNILNTRIEFLVMKQKVPLSLYVEINDVLFFGAIVNISNINLEL